MGSKKAALEPKMLGFRWISIQTNPEGAELTKDTRDQTWDRSVLARMFGGLPGS